jgi:hypothetical protein
MPYSYKRIACGVVRVVALVVDGKCQVEEYLNEIDETYRIKLFANMRAFAKNGTLRNTQKFRHLKGKICEFKADTDLPRVFCFLYEDMAICTHGKNKPHNNREYNIEINKVKKIQKNVERKN